jgi:glycosyltransferase involved in cell wall biosynthesis
VSDVSTNTARPLDPLVTIVVPVLNEEAAIPPFLHAVREALEPAATRYSVLFVNDGSTDSTWGIIAAAAQADPRVRGIALSRRFGKEAALTAGLTEADGHVVVVMDVDLQDPPDLIPRFLEQWHAGFDVVYGQRIRRDEGPLKRGTAQLFYQVFNRLTDVRIPEDTGDFRLMDRRVVRVLRELPERNRFMKGLFAWVGFRAAAVPFERPQRQRGATKWSLWRLWNFALDGITAFSTVPLRVWTYLGGAIALLALCYSLFTVVRTLLFGIDLPGYPSLMAVILFLGGVQLLSLGIIGEYLGRLVAEAKQRPLYVIADRMGHPPRD